MISGKETTLNVSNKSRGLRLDRFICDSFESLSRTYVQRLIDRSCILVNKKVTKAGYKLRANDLVYISLPELKKPKVESEKVKLDIAYEDEDVIVINKPQGMITHPTSNVYEGTLVNALLFHCKDSLSGINGVLRPGIVHRLDKETSGLIIVCKNDKSHNDIAKQIQERTLSRSYLAIVHRKVQYDRGTINKPIGRDKVHRHRMAVVQKGKAAITHWKILKKLEKYTLLECTLATGRTHQIRVHMSSLGHPIVGDTTYGKKSDSQYSDSPSMMLHAYKLVLIHPKTKKRN